MDFRKLIKEHPTILMEGALSQRLQREYGICLDEQIDLAGLVYDPQARKALKTLWEQYRTIAEQYSLPFIATTPTRRANRERIGRSVFDEDLFQKNVDFLRSIQQESQVEMAVGALMGCRGDAYTGEGALTEEEAFSFHAWTIENFKKAEVDFLYAAIMPTLPEALGLARAADISGLPTILSFTIQRDGKLIDGTTIHEAIQEIDSKTVNSPVLYMANCVHPTILYQALSHSFNQTKRVKERFLGIQANTSPLSFAQLDHSADLKSSDPDVFAQQMLRLREVANIHIWGGCCGTDQRHMETLVRNL